MSPKVLLTVSLIVLGGCAQSEPVENSNVPITAASLNAQDPDVFGDDVPGDASNAVAPLDDAGNAASGNADAPLTPPAPGTPGGLPDDRTPPSEGPIAADSAQGAASVVQSYYGLLEARRFQDARASLQPNAPDAGRDVAAFAAQFDRYSEYHANVGAPGRIDAGAGQRYVTVPVQVYARLKADRAPSYQIGTVTLHRAGDIDGATPDQRRWKISTIALKPTPSPAN
jgi:hypothetical protein